MDAPLIQIGGGADVGSIATAAEAIANVLTVCAEQRIPEAVMIEAIQALGKAASVGPVTVTGCTLTGEADNSRSTA